MDIAKASIVTARAGRDRGKRFLVLDTEGSFLLLADGKTRPVERPKRKKARHAEFFCVSHGPAADRIRSGEQITNREVRRTLALVSGDGNPDQEG